jgi:hypothetical protein
MDVLNGAERRGASLLPRSGQAERHYSVSTVAAATTGSHEWLRQGTSGLVVVPHWRGVGPERRATTLNALPGAYTDLETCQRTEDSPRDVNLRHFLGLLSFSCDYEYNFIVDVFISILC